MSFTDYVQYPKLCVSCGASDEGIHTRHTISFSHSTSKTKGFGPTKRYVTTTTTRQSPLLICKACMAELGEEAEIVKAAAERVPSHFGKLGLLLALVIAFTLPYIMTFAGGDMLGVVILFSIPIGILLAIASAKAHGEEHVREIGEKPAEFFFKWNGNNNYQVPNEQYRAAFKEANQQLNAGSGVLKLEIPLKDYKEAPIIALGIVNIIFHVIVGVLLIYGFTWLKFFLRI